MMDLLCLFSRIFFASATSLFLQSASAHASKKFNRFRFHIPIPFFMKNSSAASKSQMLPSLLPLPQKFNRFQIQLSDKTNESNFHKT